METQGTLAVSTLLSSPLLSSPTLSSPLLSSPTLSSPGLYDREQNNVFTSDVDRLRLVNTLIYPQSLNLYQGSFCQKK